MRNVLPFLRKAPAGAILAVLFCSVLPGRYDDAVEMLKHGNL